MERDTPKRIQELTDEIETIEHLNQVYRSQRGHNHVARAEYELRRIRLQEIKNELARLVGKDKL
jgi:hypothetical protein